MALPMFPKQDEGSVNVSRVMCWLLGIVTYTPIDSSALRRNRDGRIAVESWNPVPGSHCCSRQWRRIGPPRRLRGDNPAAHFPVAHAFCQYRLQGSDFLGPGHGNLYQGQNWPHGFEFHIPNLTTVSLANVLRALSRQDLCIGHEKDASFYYVHEKLHGEEGQEVVPLRDLADTMVHPHARNGPADSTPDPRSWTPRYL